MKRWSIILLFALWAGVLHAQDATPAVPFADTSLPEIITQLPNDSRASVCVAPLLDSFSLHRVRAGDTLPWLLRDTPDYTPTQIAVMNCLDDPSALPVGAVIFLPADRTSGAIDPLARLPLLRFDLANDCAYAWIGGRGAAPRCPDEPARTVYAAYQPFEGGAMIWFSDTGQIAVLLRSRTFSYVTDVYQEGMPEAPLTPPDGLFAPVRGFRLAWTLFGAQSGDLGWATAPERGFDSARQPAGRVSYTTYIALPDGEALALTEVPDSVVGFWGDVSP